MDIKSQWMCIIYLRLFHKALQKGFLTWFFFLLLWKNPSNISTAHLALLRQNVFEFCFLNDSHVKTSFHNPLKICHLNLKVPNMLTVIIWHDHGIYVKQYLIVTISICHVYKHKLSI